MRRRGIGESKDESVKQFVKNLDAFQKVPDTYVETTKSGGIVSLLCFSVVLYLTISEINYFLYTSKRYKFKYSPDADFNQTLTINLDITVKMLCQDLGADVIDITRSAVKTFGKLSYESVNWDMTEREKLQFDAKKMTSQLRENYYSVVNFIWNTGFVSTFDKSPRGNQEDGDSCRIWGQLGLNKVTGNLHVIPGKDMGLATIHVHLPFLSGPVNFSHRISHFSFGEEVPGIINPLEGDIKLAETDSDSFSYYISVISTTVQTSNNKAHAYQYSVNEAHRQINHEKGEHGAIGIFFIYDTNALKVDVLETYETLGDFLIRLCGIVGGTYATSELLYNILRLILYLLTCGKLKNQPLHSAKSSTSQEKADNIVLVEQ